MGKAEMDGLVVVSISIMIFHHLGNGLGHCKMTPAFNVIDGIMPHIALGQGGGRTVPDMVGQSISS